MNIDSLFTDQALDGLQPAQDNSRAITRVERDSRRVAPGHIYVAQAAAVERAAHIVEARSRGAALIVSEDPPAVGQLRTPHARWSYARASCASTGCDTLTIPLVAVTGTKGKSTIAHFAWWALGQGAARVGTIGWHDGVHERTNPQTTPPPDELHAFLAGLPATCPGVAFEASSHGLDQHRLAGLRLTGLAVSNIGHDHLDYHHTHGDYVHAKLSATRLLRVGGLCVVNADDDGAHLFVHAARNAGARVIALAVGRGGHPRLPGTEPATVFRRGPSWVLDAPGTECDLPVRLPGGFNAWNAAAGTLLAHATGVPLRTACERLGEVPTIPGRLELLADEPATYVDYAHTAESLCAAIAALREVHPGHRLAVVFGCGGDRDRGKRPLMGAAATAADAIVLCDDNPRSEDPAAIIASIRSGIAIERTAHVEHDRGQAIVLARTLAGPHGVVLVAGKGHETEQKFSDRTVAWDDRAHVRSLGKGQA